MNNLVDQSKFDYVIVGCGLFGSVMARELTDAGKKCLIIEKRNHIGGNCYTSNVVIDGGKTNIHVHMYGPHIFHTNDEKIWNYVNKFSKFNNFINRPKVNYKDQLYSFPINLFTLYQLWGVKTPEEAKSKLDEVKIVNDKPVNLEEWIVSQVGKDIYQKFIYGYTKKQWGRDPSLLPSFIIKRLPIRLNFDDNYFEDKYQGIPENGYTELFHNLLKGIEVQYNVDYLSNKDYYDSLAKKVIYTGPIDEFFNYELGKLEWRSLRFEHEIKDIPDYQGNAIVNYTDESIPYTRIVEHKHFNFDKSNKTVITKEYPQNWDESKEKYYPINDEKNNNLYDQYKSKIDHSKYLFGGRLATYKYYDMHQVIGSALSCAKKEIGNHA